MYLLDLQLEFGPGLWGRAGGIPLESCFIRGSVWGFPHYGWRPLGVITIGRVLSFPSGGDFVACALSAFSVHRRYQRLQV